AVVIFAAAGVAKAPVSKVAWAALRLGFVAWLVPFIFAFYPNLIGLNGVNAAFIVHMTTALVGVVAFSAAIEGWAISSATAVQRLLLAVGGAALLYPSPGLSLAGAGILAGGLFLNWRSGRIPVGMVGG